MPRRLVTYNTCIQSFQSKILNNVLFLNKKLHNFGIKPSPLCSFCNLYDKTPFHIFCGRVKCLWSDLAQSRTFNIERKTIFIFSFCIGLVTQLNGSALGVLKHHYITKRIRELLIGNSTLLYGIKESCLFATEFVETLDLNN